MGAPAPTQPRIKSAFFNLIRYFFLISLALIGLVSILVTYLATEIATNSLVSQKQREGVNIARNLTKQIFDHVLDA